MPPVRTHEEASTSAPKNNVKNRTKRSKRHQQQPGQELATLGISKIKSSLRQTRRLLAKDKLAADVRVETERRLKTLEAELAQAETARKERMLATRYHKVKFFERQKVIRKINQTKKQLSTAIDKSTKKKLNATLYDLRVDLNYIFHYPKLKKYISLFPPEVRDGQPASTTSEDDAAKTAQAREEIRSWVRSSMVQGELSGEPELEHSLDSRHRPKNKDWGGSGEVKNHLKSEDKSVLVPGDSDIEQDEFFGDDESEKGES